MSSPPVEDCKEAKQHIPCLRLAILGDICKEGIVFLLCSSPSPHQFGSVCSVTQSCPTLCNPMDCRTLGLPVHYQLPELTHVHQAGDAIQPSNPVIPFSSLLQSSPEMSQFFASIGQSTGTSASASVLPMNSQD